MSATTSKQLLLLALREERVDDLIAASWFKPVALDDDEETAKLLVRIKDFRARQGRPPTLGELNVGPFDAGALDTTFDVLFDHLKGQVRHAERERIVLELSEALTEMETFDDKAEILFGRLRELRKTEEDRATWMSFSDIPMERTKWLWQNWIPLETLTVLAGDGGKGKSTITTDIAAQLSQGFLKGEFHNQPCDVLMVNAEDSPSKIVKPRLVASGADTDRVHTIDLARHMIEIPGSIGVLEAIIEEHNVKFVVVDPFNSFLPESFSSNNDQQVRAALSPLQLMAERTGCAVVALLHTNKQGDIMGSKGFQNLARSVLVFGDHPEDETGDMRVLAHKKANYGKKQQSQTWEISVKELPHEGETIETTTISFVDLNGYTAEEIMAGAASDKSKPRDSDTRLRTDFKLRVVEALQTTPQPISAKKLASNLGSREPQLQKYLDALVESGQASTTEFDLGGGAFQTRYFATPAGPFQVRKDGTDG